MNQNNSKNKNNKIAKNTIFLYLRMFISMLIGLYTSRVVLQTLGIENFGIYNVVGGIVVMFTFINSAMASGTQRFLSYELGKKEKRIKDIFSACFYIHTYIAIIILVLSETVGLWFLNYKMNLPTDKMAIINIVYQLSLIACCFNILRVPFNAAIIAYEEMSFFAYIGILEATLKLAIVYILIFFDYDKLLLYSFLQLTVILLITVCFYLFCNKKLNEIKIGKVKSKYIYKDLINFSFWAMFGGIANVGLQQGINIIINLFYGVTVNAAVGIANQINTQVMTLVSGFQQALNPQLTRSQAEGDKERQLSLIKNASKLSFFIMLSFGFPIIINLEYIIKFWLGDYPPYTIPICNAILIGALIETLSGPLWVSIFATGKIRTYQMVISLILLLNIPLSYLVGTLKMQPEIMYIIRNAIYIIALLTRLAFLKKLINLNITDFVKDAIIPALIVLTFIAFPFYIIPIQYIKSDSLFHLLCITIFSFTYSVLIIYLIGLNKNERKYITSIILKKYKR